MFYAYCADGFYHAFLAAHLAYAARIPGTLVSFVP